MLKYSTIVIVLTTCGIMKIFSSLLCIILMISSNEQGQVSKSFGVGSCAAEYYYDSNHHQWKEDELEIDLTHFKPESFSDKLAYAAVKGVRVVFDAMTGWNGTITTQKIMQRTIFLETVAGVPGMVAGECSFLTHFRFTYRLPTISFNYNHS